MKNANNWRRLAVNPCRCGCGALVAKTFKKGHGRRRPIIDRLVDRLVQVGDCWEWTGALDAGGYGRIGVTTGHTDMVHRVSYANLVGPIPHGLHIDHGCRNRRCANPAHLDAVTQAENNRREHLTPDAHLQLVTAQRAVTPPAARDLIAAVVESLGCAA